VVGDALLGLALGAGSSLLPGPCYLVVLAAGRRGWPRALGTGVGAATGDATCATLGVVGLGLLLARHPWAPAALRGCGGVALIGFGLRHLRRPDRAPVAGRAAVPGASRREALHGFARGLATVLLNPGALITWVVLIGGLRGGAPGADAAALIAGVGLGSLASYAVVARIGVAGGRAADLGAIVSRLLVVVGALTLARVAHGWLG
jgi:threonine/homoserine/homoserine lactone efflux protein